MDRLRPAAPAGRRSAMRGVARPLALGVLVVGLATAGCSSSSPGKPSAGPDSTAAARSTSTSTSTTAAPGASSTAVPAIAGAPECRADQVAVAYQGGQAESGKTDDVFVLTNTSASPCGVRGF